MEIKLNFDFDPASLDASGPGWHTVDSFLPLHWNLVAEFDNPDSPEISYLYTTTGYLVAVRPHATDPDNLTDCQIVGYRTNW